MVRILASRASAVVITAAGPLILAGCVNAPKESSSEIGQSIADGLASAVSSLVEAAMLSLVL